MKLPGLQRSKSVGFSPSRDHRASSSPNTTSAPKSKAEKETSALVRDATNALSRKLRELKVKEKQKLALCSDPSSRSRRKHDGKIEGQPYDDMWLG